MGVLADTIDRVSRATGAPYEWVLALVTVVAGLVLAWIARRIIMVYALPLARRTRTDLDEVILQAIAMPTSLSLAFLGAYLGARAIWWQSEYDLLFDRVLPTGILVIWAVALGRLITLAVMRAARHLPHAKRFQSANIIARMGKLAIAVVLLLSLMGVWGLSLTPLLASAGIVAIAIALAAQDTLANFFAGIAVVFDRLYQVGDFIVLDPGGSSEIRGEVREIGLRSTRILTRDDVLVVVPNSVIANGRVVNETGGETQYRVHVGVDVAYESDLEHVERVLLMVAEHHPLVLPEPEARVRVRKFGDSGIRVELLAWIRDPKDRGQTIHEMSMRVHKRFREHNIRIPFPQRDVHLDPRGREREREGRADGEG